MHSTFAAEPRSGIQSRTVVVAAKWTIGLAPPSDKSSFTAHNSEPVEQQRDKVHQRGDLIDTYAAFILTGRAAAPGSAGRNGGGVHPAAVPFPGTAASP
ncbi:hypothetical protein Ari01nite_21980 [Paractinoplanes rishiriensis]|uniref:Uncharacterized protein n=1 Tax=Paractinoplanes rishiriensis TaxID=1050105 RepID=A0A919MTG7_9ACTN|nr:hypothetical protein Ari01nite_21980 [Actinoplanes rishiriensis]